MIVDDPDNSVERFAYSKRGWSNIKTVVREVLNRDADQNRAGERQNGRDQVRRDFTPRSWPATDVEAPVDPRQSER